MRVLVADDSAISRRILAHRISKWGYEVVSCNDGEEAWKALHEPDPPVLAILDWYMPVHTGVEICRRIRAEAREPYIYVILLTANDSPEALVEGLTAGADDYVKKPFNEQELEVRVRAGKRVTDLQSDLIAAREGLRVQATHDALTGLWNRGAILELLSTEIARCQREKRSLTCALIDLDHFKNVNDERGHFVGDAVLIEAARRMRAALRPYDVVGRYGGEEFLVVISGCGEGPARRRAEQVREAVGQTPMDLPGATLTVTCSIGLTVWDGLGTCVPNDLLKKADDALYRAKHLGRNRVEVGD